MTTYLEGGWFEPDGGQALRSEVIDGAMDIAGSLLRAGIQPRLIERAALRVRGLVTVSDPMMRGVGAFNEQQRFALRARLERYTAESPAMDTLVADCFEHVAGARDLFALYLHLIHIARMMQLLSLAVEEPLGALHSPGTEAKKAARKNKKVAKKKVAKKKVAKKKVKKKPAKKQKRTQKKAVGKRAKRSGRR